MLYVSPWPQDGITALHVAAQAGHVEIMRLLMDGGVDVNARNKVMHGHTYAPNLNSVKSRFSSSENRIDCLCVFQIQ